ncbi:FAD-dependent monooxygenase [Arthrobacter crystallopoietes]|uniref:2-polyprenyl-6-methoxyphenol hydroxylase n=1 Tax=Crystallibacter crystallopoietes TaxID=37928 RepID=A0A1H1HYH3_9MICC|nr:NAD(P)/FAD-dependent oxidoreductase [Arthrobacter crystallopoietes]AUI53662.1 monooxygenase [Arthrobacter crystallopoietes]AUI53844.1 monooxygenase [Arthrobacter crystallopoietes]SDR30168.1 2-polyprenyl-6-methoxyphenol hydroxylase [Arthrobacter crystallopoietes]
MHIEIAGAGLAGLTAAAAFAKAGASVRVHEKGSELREIGAGIYLWENGLRALESVGAYDEVAGRAEKVEVPFLRDHDGRTLQEEWLRNHRLYTVGRRHLHQSLVNAARRNGAELITDSPVVKASPSGTLTLADGTENRADLVIGADGVFSKVRDSLGLRKKLVDLRDGGGRHLIPRTGDDPVNQTIEQWNGGRRIGIIPCSPDETYIFLCCPANDHEGRNQQPFHPASWIESFPEFRSQLERIPANTEGRWAPFHDVHVDKWYNGRAAIVGDAAHAMSPNLGQAACVAMTNAVALAIAVTNSSNPEFALKSWESAQREMSDGVQQYSRIYGKIGTAWPKDLLNVRSALVKKFTGSRRVQATINFAAESFPSGEIRPVRPDVDRLAQELLA